MKNVFKIVQNIHILHINTYIFQQFSISNFLKFLFSKIFNYNKKTRKYPITRFFLKSRLKFLETFMSYGNSVFRFVFSIEKFIRITSTVYDIKIVLHCVTFWLYYQRIWSDRFIVSNVRVLKGEPGLEGKKNQFFESYLTFGSKWVLRRSWRTNVWSRNSRLSFGVGEFEIYTINFWKKLWTRFSGNSVFLHCVHD